MNIFLSLPELTYVPTLTTSFSINTSTIPPPIFESEDPSILGLLQHFEPTPLSYNPITTHTFNCCRFGTAVFSSIGDDPIPPLSSHAHVYTTFKPWVRVTPLVTTMLETCEPFTFISTISVSAPHTTLCHISESFSATISVPSGGDYVPLSLVHLYQLLRKSAYDSRFGIPGSYNPMFVLRVQDFWPKCLIWRIVYKISTSVFEGLATDICEIPSTSSCKC